MLAENVENETPAEEETTVIEVEENAGSEEAAVESENTEEQPAAATETEENTTPATNNSTQKQIFCGNISYSTTEEGIREYFSKFGELANILVAKKKQSEGAGHRGFAFISYVDKEISKKVLEMGNHELDGRALTIKAAKPKTTKFFVGGLDRDKTDAESLRKFFSQYGEIEDCFCPNGKKFGFVTMVEDGDNIQTILDTARFTIDGTEVDVKPAQPKKDGMGGGRGGRGGGFGRRGGYGGGYGGSYGGGYGSGAYGPPMGGGWGYPRYAPYGGGRGGGYGGRRGY